MINTGIYKNKDFEADMRDHLDKLEMYKYELELAKKEKDDVDIDMFTLCAIQESNLIRGLVIWSDAELVFSRRCGLRHEMFV